MNTQITRIALCIVSFQFVAQFVLAKKGELTFPSTIEISPRQSISLYDIVEAKGVAPDVLDSLRSIEIGDAQTRTISKTTLIKKLRGVETFFLFPAEVKILRSNQKVSRMELERKIKNQLLSQCGQCEYQIQINSVPQNLNANWALDLNVDLNKNSIMVPIYSENNIQQKGWVTAEVRKYAVAAVLNQSVRVGEVITADMVTMEKRLIQNMTDAAINAKNLIGMQAARFLSARQVLSFRDLKKETILKRGQVVKAFVGKGNFEVSIMAQAEEAGSIGDVIKVKNIDSQKLFAGRVVDRGIVQIE